MSSHKSASGPPIQKLIDEREQLGQWLERLASASDKPEAVRAKVKAGYEKRLAEIMAELQGYQKEIEEALKRQRALHEAFQAQEKEAIEELAEAELRHSVGEFAEAGWKKASAEITGTLNKVREGLKAAAESVAKVEVVLAMLGRAAAPKAKPLGTQPEASVPGTSRMSEFIADPDPVVPTMSQPQKPAPRTSAGTPAPAPAGRPSIATSPLTAPVRPSAPTMAPARASGGAPIPPAPAKQTDAFDELAFLKSVTNDDSATPSAARASGMARLSSSEPVIPDQAILDAQAAPQAPRPAPRPTGSAVTPVPSPRPTGAAVTPVPAPTPGGGQTGAKTVKCRDCGTMNLPTEWYCEKCGAELSVV